MISFSKFYITKILSNLNFINAYYNHSIHQLKNIPFHSKVLIFRPISSA